VSARIGGHVLDIGAGEGAVTLELAPLFDGALCTEVSQQMAKKLRNRGFSCIHSSGTGSLVDEVREFAAGGPIGGDKKAPRLALRPAPGAPAGALPEFSAISLLNVLDRCDKPLSMLSEILQLMRPPPPQGSPAALDRPYGGGTLLLVALVLPFGPFVETPGGRKPPSEQVLEKFVRSHNCCWETAASQVVHRVLEPMGFEVCAVGRCPYLDQWSAPPPPPLPPPSAPCAPAASSGHCPLNFFLVVWLAVRVARTAARSSWMTCCWCSAAGPTDSERIAPKKQDLVRTHIEFE
jgi:hypothetical protein